MAANGSYNIRLLYSYRLRPSYFDHCAGRANFRVELSTLPGIRLHLVVEQHIKIWLFSVKKCPVTSHFKSLHYPVTLS